MEQRDVMPRAETSPGFRQVMRIYREPPDACPRARLQRPISQWPVEKRHQRLRQPRGKRAQAITQSGTEDESLLHAA